MGVWAVIWRAFYNKYWPAHYFIDTQASTTCTQDLGTFNGCSRLPMAFQ